ncbi:MAG TPA: hypothetical protein VF473_07105 [Cyclobacteriaceae bacterium]
MKAVVCCVLMVVGCASTLFAQKEIEKIDNKDKSFTLVKNDTTNASGIPVLKYKVMRNADKRIVVEGSVTMGSLEWTSDYELTESKSLGAGQSNQGQPSRRIDLRPYLLKN